MTVTNMATFTDVPKVVIGEGHDVALHTGSVKDMYGNPNEQKGVDGIDIEETSTSYGVVAVNLLTLDLKEVVDETEPIPEMQSFHAQADDDIMDIDILVEAVGNGFLHSFLVIN